MAWLRFRNRTPTMADVQRVKQARKRLRLLSDKELRLVRQELSNQIQRPKMDHASPFVIEAVALITESFQRSLGIELYDVQILAALITSTGRIAEMQTGEGKTFVTAIPAFVHALVDHGVHVATTNAYLAARDYSEVKPVFDLLGTSIGLLPEELDQQATRNAYQCDVTYGTGYQFGFDFLRDQLARQSSPTDALGGTLRSNMTEDQPSPLRQHAWNFAVIDEIDSVLIDEALTPLVLSGPGNVSENPSTYLLAQSTVQSLVPKQDYTVDIRMSQIQLNSNTVEKTAPQSPQITLIRPWRQYLQNALRAMHLLKRDEHYIVRNAEIALVDQCTGRIFSDRKWRDGLHQAVQAKEGLAISPSESSLAQMTRQRYFQGYQGICGLTGTTTGGELEFRNVYQLECASVPTNKPSQRKVLPRKFFAHDAARIDAILEDVCASHVTGQPVLIGTQTIQQTLDVSAALKYKGYRHAVLNGLQDEAEADIISKAGQSGSIVVATNMAGRGTDIKLSQKGIEAYGLHVIGVGANPARRIDRQLIGRAGRQGAPGVAQFFICAQDQLIVKQDPRLAQAICDHSDAQGRCQKDFSKQLEELQVRVEEQQVQQRQQMLQRDNWSDSMRKALFSRSARFE